MKDWLTIGQFAELVGVSAKALRLYEKMGLLKSPVRGENSYRYYMRSQLALALRLKEFKQMGFSLEEIKDLLHADENLNREKIKSAMQNRFELVCKQVDSLRNQKEQIENVLNSLRQETTPLGVEDRRVIMNLYGKVSIVVTGIEGLEKSAFYIQRHFREAGQNVAIYNWKESMSLPTQKPYILIIPEKDLISNGVLKIEPDVIVIKNISSLDSEIKERYLKLYHTVKHHVNTVINADDRASVALVESPQIKKSRYFYFSKNGSLKDQISKIGGVVSDGEELEIFGFNLKTNLNLKLGKIFPHEDEVCLLSSLGAVMTVGLSEQSLNVG